MEVTDFENKRWQREDQVLQWRHRAALDLMGKGTVLDLGSGDGLLLSLLKERGIEGEGLDLSEVGVRKANAKGLKTRMFDFGNNRLPYVDGSFDTVVLLDVLEHLYDPESVVCEAYRVSRRHVVIGVPNFNSLPARLQVLVGKVPENNQPKKGHVYWFNRDTLLRMVSRVGFDVEVSHSNTLFESRPVIAGFMRLLVKWLPGIFSLSFVVRGVKRSKA